MPVIILTKPCRESKNSFIAWDPELNFEENVMKSGLSEWQIYPDLLHSGVIFLLHSKKFTMTHVDLLISKQCISFDHIKH